MRYGEDTVEHIMGEYPLIHRPMTRLTETYLIAINLINNAINKALKLKELWKAKLDLPWILQPGQLDYAVDTAACLTTTYKLYGYVNPSGFIMK